MGDGGRWAGRRAAYVKRSACAVICVAVAACGPGIRPLDASFGAGIFTPDRNDTYGITRAGDMVVAAAPTSNVGGGTRAGFWLASDPRSEDQETCATWVDAPGVNRQQGAVLRARTLDGRTKAITVTNNVIWGARWGFNIHVMDSGAATPYHKIAGFLLEEVFRPGGPESTLPPPHPWRMCARVVGDVVSFIVWPLTHEQPAWDDPRYGGSVTLPEGWGTSGRPGWYIGHLVPGEWAGFTDMTTAVIVPDPPDPPETTTTTAATTTVPDTTTTEPEPVAGALADGTAGPEPTLPPRDPTWIVEAP